MDEIEISKQLEQTQEEYKKVFASYRQTLEEAVQNKDKELARTNQELRNLKVQREVLQRSLYETQLELKDTRVNLELTKSREEVKRQGTRFQILIASLIYLISTILAGFGVNLVTATSPNSTGYIILALSALLYLLATFTTVFLNLNNRV